MSIFDRITRLARSEANDLADKVKDAIGDLRSGGDDDGGAGPHDSDRKRAQADLEREHNAQEAFWKQNAPKDPHAGSAWPKQIREDYAALELPLGADRAEAKEAYRGLMRKYHPDRHQGNDERAKMANEVSMRLRQSYERIDEFLKAREK